jgi:tetratricopeptide (TPR) repeat protein
LDISVKRRYGAAEIDCTLAIEIDKSYVKAYLRRGTVRFNLKKFDAALEDYKSAIKLEPTNKQSKEEIINIERILESKVLVYPIDKPIEKRSSKPLKQIIIEEINDDKNERLQGRLSAINSKVKLTKDDEKLFDVETKSRTPEPKVSDLVPEAKNNDDEPKQSDTIAEKIENLTVKPNKSFSIPNAPTNGYQLRKDWQLMNNNLDDLTKYFQVLAHNL